MSEYKRKRMLEVLDLQTSQWDGSADGAVDLLKHTERTLQEIEQQEQTEEETEYWKQILDRVSNMQSILQTEQKKVLFQLEQLNKKDKVADSYLKETPPSIFVDKEF